MCRSYSPNDSPRYAALSHPLIHREQEGAFKCLPYFQILGVSKCGTTDLYNRLTEHPDMVDCTWKVRGGVRQERGRCGAVRGSHGDTTPSGQLWAAQWVGVVHGVQRSRPVLLAEAGRRRAVFGSWLARGHLRA